MIPSSCLSELLLISYIPKAFVKLFSLPDAISQTRKNDCHITCSPLSLDKRDMRKNGAKGSDRDVHTLMKVL